MILTGTSAALPLSHRGTKHAFSACVGIGLIYRADVVALEITRVKSLMLEASLTGGSIEKLVVGGATFVLADSPNPLLGRHAFLGVDVG